MPAWQHIAGHVVVIGVVSCDAADVHRLCCCMLVVMPTGSMRGPVPYQAFGAADRRFIVSCRHWF